MYGRISVTYSCSPATTPWDAKASPANSDSPAEKPAEKVGGDKVIQLPTAERTPAFLGAPLVVDEQLQVHWLPLSRVISAAERYGGAVTVERYAHGVLALHLYVPLAVKSESEARALLPAPSGPPRVLILDDDHVVTRTLGQYLQEVQCPSVVADDFGRALNVLKENVTSIDLLLIDAGVCGMDETQVAASLKRIKDGLKVVVMVDSRPEANDQSDEAKGRRARLLADGEVAILAKPIERKSVQTLARQLAPESAAK
jgi:CheY-like chemotaxis protein